MTRRLERITGAVASVAFYLLVGPVAVAVLAAQGWPLPSQVSLDAVSRALSDGVEVEPQKALALFGWVVWTCIAWSTLAVLVGWVTRKRPRRLLIPLALQPLLGRLATGVFLLSAASHTDVEAPPRLAAVVSARVDPAAPEHGEAVSQLATTAAAHARAVEMDAAYLLVRRHDTLSGLAAGLLRTENPAGEDVKHLVRDLVDANLGALQADGRTLTDEDEIEVGWWLQLPDAVGLPPGGYLMVEHGDNLWDIAEECLDSPDDRHELVALNVGRVQPDGRALQDANYVREWWLLRVPDRFVQPMLEARGASSSELRAEATPAPPVAARTVEQASSPTTTVREDAREAARRGPDQPSPLSVELPSGSVVAASFLAGVLATISAGRLKRRRRWRPEEPRPGLAPPGEPRAVALRPRTDHDADGEPVSSSTGAVSPPTTAAGGLEVGRSDEAPEYIDAAAVGGVELTGAGAEAAARAWVLAALVARDAGGQPAVLVDSSSARVMFGDDTAVPGVRVADTQAEMLALAEVELARRARLFQREGARTFEDYAAVGRDEPLQHVLLVFVVPVEDPHRTSAIARLGRHLGVGIVAAASWSDAGLRLTVDGTGSVGDNRVSGAAGLVLYIASTREAMEVVTALRESNIDAEVPADRPSGQAEPEVAAPTGADSPALRVRLLGGLDILAGSEEIRTGLRSKARELLAFMLLRPSGTTAEYAVDRMWPDADADQGPDWWKKSLSNLRQRVRNALGRDDVDVVESLGNGRYRAVASEIDVDVWRFEAALAAAVEARGDPETEAAALDRALSAYGGDLVDGFLYDWAEPLRADLRSRALDAAARLATIYEDAGRHDDALRAIDRGIAVDGLAEELYARGVRILCDIDRPDAARRLLDRLERCLLEIGEEPLSTTAAPLARLLADRARREHAQLRPADA